MNTKRIGNIGEAKVLAEFVKWGIPIYIQFGDTERADYIADFNGKLNKIQVKTAEKLLKDRGSFIVHLYSLTTKNGKQVQTPYSKEEVDYFAIYCIESDTLILYPNNESAETVCVRLCSTRNNQTRGTHYASDYTFDKWFDRDVSPLPDKE